MSNKLEIPKKAFARVVSDITETMFPKLVQKKREELQNLKNDYTKIENEKIELEIKYNNLLEENKSLEKINQNYETNKKMLYQGIEQENKNDKEKEEEKNRIRNKI